MCQARLGKLPFPCINSNVSNRRQRAACSWQIGNGQKSRKSRQNSQSTSLFFLHQDGFNYYPPPPGPFLFSREESGNPRAQPTQQPLTWHGLRLSRIEGYQLIDPSTTAVSAGISEVVVPELTWAKAFVKGQSTSFHNSSTRYSIALCVHVQYICTDIYMSRNPPLRFPVIFPTNVDVSYHGPSLAMKGSLASWGTSKWLY